MGWTVGWLAEADPHDPAGHPATGPWQPPHAPLTASGGGVREISPARLAKVLGVQVAEMAELAEKTEAAGLALASPPEGEPGQLSPRIDRYRRPCEGTDAPRAAMQAYRDWGFGLVAQLGRDGTHGFQVLPVIA